MAQAQLSRRLCTLRARKQADDSAGIRCDGRKLDAIAGTSTPVASLIEK